MPKLNSTVKSVRIDNEKLAELEAKIGEKSINAWFNECIERFLSGEEVGLPSCGSKDGISATEKEGLPQNQAKSESKYNIDEDILDDLATMQTFAGGSVEEMIRRFDEALNVGSIICEGERFVGVSDIYLGDFKDKCREMNIDPQKALDKWVKEMK